jgi:hypothetical protein
MANDSVHNPHLQIHLTINVNGININDFYGNATKNFKKYKNNKRNDNPIVQINT